MKNIIIIAALLSGNMCLLSAQNTLTAQEKKDGWQLLFDGTTTQGWHNYRSTTINPQWKVVDGALTLTEKNGGDIVTADEFENFELKLDWKISDCGNSGLFYGVLEDTASWAWAVYATGPEMQILDDKCHPDNKLETHRAGALYDMLPCSKATVKPAGQWNEITLKINKGKAEHWQNGTKVVEYTLWTPEWDAMVAKSKFNGWKGFGKYKKGKIALQDHGDVVSFRNIKIRKL
ncbi:MAG: DUF1080 domain-containing protein [Cytophagales bacterium]|nr:DUF1080 domain-containing protein [Cytophagales bacterium]